MDSDSILMIHWIKNSDSESDSTRFFSRLNLDLILIIDQRIRSDQLSITRSICNPSLVSEDSAASPRKRQEWAGSSWACVSLIQRTEICGGFLDGSHALGRLLQWNLFSSLLKGHGNNPASRPVSNISPKWELSGIKV